MAAPNTLATAPVQVPLQWEIHPEWQKIRSDFSQYQQYYDWMAQISFHSAHQYQKTVPVLWRSFDPLNRGQYIPYMTINASWPPTKNPSVWLSFARGRLELDYVRQLAVNMEDILQKIEKVKAIMYQVWLDHIKSNPNWNAFFKTAFNQDGTPAIKQLGKDFEIAGLPKFTKFEVKTSAPPKAAVLVNNDPFADDHSDLIVLNQARAVKHSAIVGEDGDQDLFATKRAKSAAVSLLDF